MKAISVFVTAAVLGLGWGCRKERSQPAVKPALASPAPPKVELPRLEAPKAPQATRVVDLFYTANVGGDAEPCG